MAIVYTIQYNTTSDYEVVNMQVPMQVCFCTPDRGTSNRAGHYHHTAVPSSGDLHFMPNPMVASNTINTFIQYAPVHTEGSQTSGMGLKYSSTLWM